MLALEFTFPAGRYHATPWDAHVNEGVVAWPPEPWRILRGLIATWHHKIKWNGKHTEATLLGLIESLAQELPEYSLPAATHSHTRHYMPQFAVGKTSLVFDAFAAVDREDALIVAWPSVDLPGAQGCLLDDLLAVMGYLGRAESWVEAKRLETIPDILEARKCKPGTSSLDLDTGEIKGEVVTLVAPLPVNDYQNLRGRFLVDKKAVKKFGGTLPDSLLEALSVGTSDLRKLGWSQPPAARKVSYLRPVDALRPRRAAQKSTAPRYTTACFLLIGKPLPRVEDTLRIGELLRQAVMSKAKDMLGEDNVPAIFSGHGMPEGNRHGHAFYLPWDANGDGRIERVLLHVQDGMASAEYRIVETLQGLWSRDGSKWRLVLENIGDPGVGGSLTSGNVMWESITPYMHPWHLKKGFTVEDQIRRECRERGLPEPVVLEELAQVPVGSNRYLSPIKFHRVRSKRGLEQPDRRGSFWRINFSEPVAGPLALGFGCHFGLGLFRSSRTT